MHLAAHDVYTCAPIMQHMMSAHGHPSSCKPLHRWNIFLTEAKWQHRSEEDLFLQEDAKTGEWTPNANTFVRFAFNLYDHHVEDHMHHAQFKRALAWMWNKLNVHLTHKGVRQVPEGYILSLPGVRAVAEDIAENDRRRGMLSREDIQAHVDTGITAQQMLSMCYTLWQRELPAETSRNHTTDRPRMCHDLYQLTVLYELRATHQTQQRHNDVSLEVFCHNFIRDREEIGPRGMPVYCQLSQGGKTNKNHNYHYSVLIPHKNPILCALFAKGALFLYRYIVMGEHVPDWRNKDYLFETRTLRQVKDASKTPSYKTLNSAFSRLYKKAGILCQKVLHQGRRQGQQELADSGFDPYDIKR